MNGDGVASRVFPVGYARRDFPICHVLLGQLSWGRTQHRRWWGTRSFGQFSMFVHRWSQGVKLHRIDSGYSLFVEALIPFGCEFDHFGGGVAKFLNVGTESCFLFDA